MDPLEGLLFYLLGLLLILPRVVGSMQMTVVSDNGTDSVECLNGGETNQCESLSFVLNHNSYLNCGNSCDILLLNDQSLTSQVSTVKGRVSISSPNDITLTASHWNISGSSSPADSLLLANVALIIGGHMDIRMFDSVHFINIKFDCLLQWTCLVMLSEINTLRFDGAIVQSFACTVPSGHVNSFGWLVVQNISSVKFFDCVFQDGFFVFPTYFLSLSNFTNAVFDSCVFRNNSFDHTGMIRLSIDTAESSVEIRNCDFVRNTMESDHDGNNIHRVPLVDISACKGSLTIEDTKFIDNYATQTYRGMLIELKEMCKHSVVNNTVFAKNVFILMEVLIPPVSKLQYKFDMYSLLLRNNTASNNLISFQPLGDFNFDHISVSVTLKGFFAIDNHVLITYQHNDMNCVIFFQELKHSLYNLTAIDSEFVQNAATPIGIQGAVLNVYGQIWMYFNSALKGGAIYAYKNLLLNFAENSTVVFSNNTAQYGGAIYILDGCPMIANTSSQNFSLTFLSNYATNFGGTNIYLYHNICDCEQNSKLFNYHIVDGSPLIVSYPTNIELANASDFLTFFPGERIFITINVTNCESTNSSCLANVYLVCSYSYYAGDDVLCDPSQLYISGPPSIFIHSGKINTDLQIMTNNRQSSRGIMIKLLLSCRDQLPSGPTNASFPIRLTDCPFGMIFDNSSKQCECVAQTSSAFLCRRPLGKACIKKGYWIGQHGNNNDIIVHQCPSSFYCNNGGSKCPEYLHTGKDTSEYVELDLFNKNGFDGQCESEHGGTLCMYCAENKTFTYLAIQCMPNDQCKPWHSTVLMLTAIMLNFVIGSAIIVVVRVRFSIGSGYLYGPIFYLAVVNQLLSHAGNDISGVVSLFTSVYLLEFEIIGFAPLCFFSNMNPLYSVGLRFVTPLLFSLILMLTVVLARFCPNTCLKLQPNPVKSMSVLLLISFWSLVNTSIGILHYAVLVTENGEKMFVPYFHPDIHYFTHGHIPLVIIAICVLVVIAVYMLVMVFAQCFSFYRLKPFLDEFQSCYQHKYRWYSVVYACSMVCMAPLAISDYAYATHAIILAVTLAQCILQPYRKKWLNIVDTVLLVDLTFVTVFQDYHNTNWTIVTWILVMIPLTYIALGTVLLLLLGTNATFKKIPCVKSLISSVKRKRNHVIKWCQSDIQSDTLNHPQYSTLPPSDIFTDDGEREPLIGIIQED